jgi:hypothetical protein
MILKKILWWFQGRCTVCGGFLFSWSYGKIYCNDCGWV